MPDNHNDQQQVWYWAQVNPRDPETAIVLGQTCHQCGARLRRTPEQPMPDNCCLQCATGYRSTPARIARLEIPRAWRLI